jgi:hypothetical protein
MRKAVFAMGLIAAVFMAGSVAVLAQSGPTKEAKKEGPAKAVTFATLSGVKAQPMAPRELSAVKGLHIHFTTPSSNAGHPLVDPATGWHFVNQTQNNLGNGQAPAGAGPGYSGLCGAALKSGAITIPGQNPTTGVGGGC